MQNCLKLIGLAAVISLNASCAQAADPSSADLKDESARRRLIKFSTEKEQQARELARKLDWKISPRIWRYFEAAKRGDAPEVTRLFANLKKGVGQYAEGKPEEGIDTVVWQTAIEVQTAYDAFVQGRAKYVSAFGQGIINSIPAGGIYFGGTDAGRGVVTALCGSHAQADPFFTITQNALADARYLTYLREMYGGRIYVPTGDDSQQAFSDYLADERKTLLEAADFAFRQAYALCPYSPEAIFRYVNLLVGQARVGDALLVARASAKMDPDNQQIDALIQQLERMEEMGQQLRNRNQGKSR